MHCVRCFATAHGLVYSQLFRLQSSSAREAFLSITCRFLQVDLLVMTFCLCAQSGRDISATFRPTCHEESLCPQNSAGVPAKPADDCAAAAQLRYA